MRRPAPVSKPVVLTIAGSDSGGGAGIQADLKTIEARGGFGTSTITALTAQNTRGVDGIEVVEPSFVDQQIEVVVSDIGVDAVKTGMLATAPIIRTVTGHVEAMETPIVVDPVMVAASGDRLLDRDAESAYDDLIQEATVVTPNADEAEVLTGVAIDDREDAIDAGSAIVDLGATAALIKGGHWGGPIIEDVLVTESSVEVVTHDRVDTSATHGSGCSLASAVATGLARDDRLEDAVVDAIEYLGRAVRYHHDIGEGPGAVNHLVGLENRAAAEGTIESVRRVVAELIAGDIGKLVPEVGMNVVGATPYAESERESVAIDGRLTRTLEGIDRIGDIRFAASGHVARLVLAVREVDPSIRFGANCRFNDQVAEAMDRLGWETVEIDRDDQPPAVRTAEGSTMAWIAEVAYDRPDARPTAVFDRGAPGKEPMTRIMTETAGELATRLLELSVEVD